MRKTPMQSTTLDESEQSIENRKDVPILDGFSDRLSLAIGSNSVRKVAQSAGLSEGTLRSLLRGGLPSLESAVRLCDALNVRLGWLAYSEEPMRPEDAPAASYLHDSDLARFSRLDQPVETLATIIATVDQLVLDLGIKADVRLKAQLVAAIYQSAAEHGSIEPVVEKLRLTLGALHAKSA